jgi:hypothetical protein
MPIYRKGEDQFELEHRALLQGNESSEESKDNKKILRDKNIKVHRTADGETELRKDVPLSTSYTRGGKAVQEGGYSHGMHGYTYGISGRDVADVKAEK